jgi:hypothetical protein
MYGTLTKRGARVPPPLKSVQLSQRDAAKPVLCIMLSAAGVDLNRCWDKATQQTHPTIFHARYAPQYGCFFSLEPARSALVVHTLLLNAHVKSYNRRSPS